MGGYEEERLSRSAFCRQRVVCRSAGGSVSPATGVQGNDCAPGERQAGRASCRDCRKRFRGLCSASRDGFEMQPLIAEFARTALTAQTGDVINAEGRHCTQPGNDSGRWVETGPGGKRKDRTEHLRGRSSFVF